MRRYGKDIVAAAVAVVVAVVVRSASISAKMELMTSLLVVSVVDLWREGDEDEEEEPRRQAIAG